MQSRLRKNLATRLAFFAVLIGLFGAIPQFGHAQATSSLPKSWNDAVAELGDKIAAAISPATPVAIDVMNISSLDAASADRIRAALGNELRRHSFQISPANSSGTQLVVHLQFTLSESAEGYLWVVQIPNNPQNAIPVLPLIVAVLKTLAVDENVDQPVLSLEKRFVWRQEEKFLDFAVLKNLDGEDEALLILETNRLAFFKMSSARWQFASANPIPVIAPRSRDARGLINTKKTSVTVGEQECVANPDFTGTLKCTPDYTLGGPSVEVPGAPNSLGAPIHGSCQNEFTFLFTGPGDWTQADTMQGYLTKSFSSPIVPSGNTVQFDGPVIYLVADPEKSSARAVVHNLKTGDYEAYVVTATCGR
jgi:hypothetical protein